MTDLIPRSVLFGNPERSSASISPDGLRLAYLAPVDGVHERVGGPPSADGSSRPSPTIASAPSAVRWADDNRHLVYLQDTGGDENWHVHVIDLETGGDRDVTPFPTCRRR